MLMSAERIFAPRASVKIQTVVITVMALLMTGISVLTMVALFAKIIRYVLNKIPDTAVTVFPDIPLIMSQTRATMSTSVLITLVGKVLM
jgi:uncharacterized membrane protein